ncbi:unnamed protein product [Camellia sinensis]
MLREHDITFANRDVPELANAAVAKGDSDIVFSPYGPGSQMLRKGRGLKKQSLGILKNEGDAKTPLTMTHLKVLFMDMVLGGTETTSNAIEFAMAEMMNKPEVMKKAQQELETVVGKDSIVEESHINKLPYL